MASDAPQSPNGRVTGTTLDQLVERVRASRVEVDEMLAATEQASEHVEAAVRQLRRVASR
jgi:hypothetical protein